MGVQATLPTMRSRLQATWTHIGREWEKRIRGGGVRGRET